MGYVNFSRDENITTQHLIVVAHSSSSNVPNDDRDLQFQKYLPILHSPQLRRFVFYSTSRNYLNSQSRLITNENPFLIVGRKLRFKALEW